MSEQYEKYKNAELESLECCKQNCKKGRYWYDRVYLCYDNRFPNKTLYGKIFGFNCFRYKSVMEACEAYDKNNILSKKDKEEDIIHAIIPICKWMPPFLDKYILNRKLRNVFWFGKIQIKIKRDN